MESVHFQASIHNVTQIDKLQNGEQRTPIAHQEHNIANARDEAVRRTEMPVQPDEAEGKVIDPEDRRREERRRSRKRRKRRGKKGDPEEDGGKGSHIDINA